MADQFKRINIKVSEYDEYEKLAAELSEEMGTELKVVQMLSMAVNFYRKNRTKK